MTAFPDNLTPKERRERCPKPADPTPASFWWAYALVLVALAAVWRACAS